MNDAPYRPRQPLSRRARLLGVAATVFGLVILAVIIVTLSFRQAPFTVSDHTLDRLESAIIGTIRNRGPSASGVHVEAYLYDSENRYVATVQTPLGVVEGEIPFRIPLSSGLADRVARYSLYVGDEPNPYAPDRL